MWSLHTANDEHWVPIATIVSFKRMREFQPRGAQWVTDLLRTSGELEVSEDGTKVRRRTEVQEPKGAFDRSVYAVCPLHKCQRSPLLAANSLQKGFGEEVPGLQRKLERFFSDYGKVAAVRMRRVDGTKAFKVRPTLSSSRPQISRPQSGLRFHGILGPQKRGGFP
jgi:lupus La protein